MGLAGNYLAYKAGKASRSRSYQGPLHPMEQLFYLVVRIICTLIILYLGVKEGWFW